MLKIPRPQQFIDPNHIPHDEVLKAIGYMAAVAAGIEDELHAIYWKYAGLTDKAGPTITGEMRPNRMTEDIIKLAKLSNIDESKLSDLKALFSDLKELTAIRNQCIHWLWDKTGPKSPHKIYAPSYKPGMVDRIFTSEDLKKVAADLAWIEVRLQAHYLSEKALLRKRAKLGAEKDLYAPAPWLGKPT